MHTDRQLLTGYTWFSSLVLASMSQRAAFSCIGCRSVGGSSSSCAVSCSQSSTGSARTSWVPSTAVVHVAVFDHRRRRTSLCRGYAPSSGSVPSRMPARLRGTHCRRTYVLSPILVFFRKRLKAHFFSLAFCVCRQFGWLCNAPMTYHTVAR